MKQLWLRNAILLTLGTLLFVLPAVHARAEDAGEDSPGKFVQETIAKVRDTVSHHPAGASVDELDSKLEGLILPVFDFREMARRSLGKNWNSGSNEQRKEFVDLFTKLLSDTYLKRIREIEKSTVSYVGERVHGSRAVVKTVVTQEGQDFPIDYRMGKQGEVWRVYDVVIENISLVSNYRSEFAGIIRKDSFSGLLERLRQKRAEMVASRNEGDAA